MRLPSSFALFILSLCFLLATGAGAVGYYIAATHSFPSGQIETLLNVGNTFLETGVLKQDSLLPPRKPGAPEERFFFYDKDRAPHGYRAMMDYNLERDNFQVELFDPTGKLVWTWPVADPAIKGSGGDGEPIRPHGMIITRNGSIIINGVDESKILARYDRCGQPEWVIRDYYHHLMTEDPVEGIWTWYGGGPSAQQDQYMVRFDPKTGKELERISLIRDVILAHPSTRKALNLPDYFQQGAPHPGENRVIDLFHPNDVEALPAALADRFPMFKPGDLLFSLRDLNFVGVLDRKTKVLKWSRQGPWIAQHDADFTADGRITVFNNNFANRYEKRGDVLAVDPDGGTVAPLFSKADAYYSDRMGVQQDLGNGILHITIPHEGRVIEVDTRTDKLVFEFNDWVLPGRNGHVANSVWLPEDYFEEDPAGYSCAR